MQPLLDFDWTFDAVPDGELVACCYWEYARESAFIRELRQRCMKEQQLEGARDKQLHHDLQRVQSIGHPARMFLHGFFCPPDGVFSNGLPPLRPGEVHRLTGSFPKPWQLLTKEERQFRAYIPPRGVINHHEFVPFRRGHSLDAKDIAQTVTQQQRLAEEAREQVRHDHPKWSEEAPQQTGKLRYPDIRAEVLWESGTEKAVVEINWGIFTNEEIVQSFRKWVKTNRPQDVPAPSDKGHKPGDVRAYLTRLAVMRLLAHYTPKQIIGTKRETPIPECQAIHQTKQFKGRKWGDSTKWYDARREARQLFHTLFPFLSESDKPISWERQFSGK